MPPTDLEATAPVDAFDSMTDRELLLSMARAIHEVRGLVAEVAAQAGPAIGMISKNPMLKLLLK